jgi:hypothetical protein
MQIFKDSVRRSGRLWSQTVDAGARIRLGRTDAEGEASCADQNAALDAPRRILIRADRRRVVLTGAREFGGAVRRGR